jgi:hypothetical protein
MRSFPGNFLSWRGILDDSHMLGLYNGSLHEVLKTTTAKKGQAQVSALGFNISCGYVTANIQLVELVPVNPVSGFSGSGFDLTVNGVPAFIFSHCMSFPSFVKTNI